MKTLLLTLCALFLWTAAHAASTNMTLTYSPPDVPNNWISAGDKSYMSLEDEELVTAKRRIAVKFFAGNTQIAEVWDDPTGDRLTNISTDLEGRATTHITAQAYAYQGGPWIASTTYALGEKISVGDYPSEYYWWEASRAGATGTVEPEWPTGRQCTLARQKTLTITAAVDNLDGTVTIVVETPTYQAGDTVTIAGTINYDGDYLLPDQTSALENQVIITATYVAETFLGTETIQITGAEAVDNLDGTVNLPLPAHGYTAGQNVTITNSVNYDGTYLLGTQTDPDQLTITVIFVVEPMAGATAMITTVDDPDVAGVEWTFTTGTQETWYSETTRRKIGRFNAGVLQRSGSRFVIRNN